MHKTKQNKPKSWSLHLHRGSSHSSCESRPLSSGPEGDVVEARLHGPARYLSGTAARMRSSPVDTVYCFPGLQAAICYETTQIQRRVSFHGQWVPVSLLKKQVIRAVPNEQAQQGFYSRYFLIPKRGSSSLRPMLDLCMLSLAPRVFSRCVEAALSLLRSGIRIFSHLDYYLIQFMQTGTLRFCYGGKPSQDSRIQHKLGKEPCGPHAIVL